MLSMCCWPSVSLLWKNVYAGFLTIFLSGLFVSLILNCMSYLYIFYVNPLSVISFVNIFFHSVGCLFILLTVSFALQKLMSFWCSLVVQWLGLSSLMPGLLGSFPGQGTKISASQQAVRCTQSNNNKGMWDKERLLFPGTPHRVLLGIIWQTESPQ